MAIITTSDTRVNKIVEDMDRRRENCRVKEIKEAEIKANWKELRKKGFGFAAEGRTPVILDSEQGRMLHDILPD